MFSFSIGSQPMNTKYFRSFNLIATACLTVAGNQHAFCREPATNSSAVLKYEEPKSLAGTIYAKSSDRKNPLFIFTRAATRSGSTLEVVRNYSYPDGKLAARERVRD